MNEPEVVLWSGSADMLSDGNFLGGTLRVTSARAAFRAFWWTTEPDVEVPLGVIAAVSMCSLSSANVNGIELVDSRGGSWRFLVPDPAAAAQAVGHIVATYGRPAPYR